MYNPLATYITAGATAISANPLTTVASFGNAYGKESFPSVLYRIGLLGGSRCLAVV
jgi:hypothetical protein